VDILSTLEQVPLFASLTKDELAALASNLQPVELAAGEILFCEDDPGGCFYIIAEGQMEIVKAMNTDEERLLQHWGPGNFLGEMSMFDPEGRRTASVRAQTPAKLLAMSHASFQSLLNQQPGLAFELTRQLSLRLRNTDNAIIHDLQEKNRQLAAAYAELKAAQLQIIEKEKLEHELDVAREIQQSILPHTLPEMPGLDVGALMHPARAVGGDLYDLIALDEKHLGIVIGDVSDKGVPAAIFMGLCRSLLRAEASRMAAPAVVLNEVNRHLMDMNEAGQFVTVLYGVMDCEQRVFTYARAGHEIPFIFQADGTEIIPPKDRGRALGLFDDINLDETSVPLLPGSRIVFFTDGATDAVNPQGELFGRERLRQTVRQQATCPAQVLCQALHESITGFQKDAPQADDIALVAVCVN
jgi:serine phosphatase RsbU (regulator of sigma subunit)